MIGSVNVPGASAADLAKVKKVADDAATAAGNATTVANEAKTAAGNAVTAAGNAQTTANEAKTAAGNAQSAASNAQTVAGNAATAASNAQTIANEAKSVAEAAQKAAEEAKASSESNAGGCAIKITFDSGFAGQEYTVTDGDDETYKGTVPEGLVVTVSVKDCNTEYTISAEADNGVTYTNSVTTGPYYGQYTASLTVFTASIVVTAVAGAAITVVGEGDTYTGTAGSNGKATIQVKKSGSYSVQAQYSDANSNTATVEATTNGGSYNATVSFITLEVTIDSGSAVTVTDGSKTLTGTSTGTVKFYLPYTGTWNISATLGDQSASGSVSATAYSAYTVELSYVKIFGVMWSKGTSTALSRLTKANDPNAHVNVDITTEPSPAVGTGAGSSPFDSYAPWSGMEEYNIVSNAVSYKKGESGFSRTSNDTVVYIPEFYFKIVEISNKMYFYVADKPATGFTKHPGSGKYVGRYQTGASYVSKSGLAPLTNITRATARTNSKNKGSKWSQYDYASWCAVWLLCLVEFADWDSQTVIGRGNVDSGSVKNTGGTDSMTYHTGRAAGTDGSTQVQYRGIEDPWGNVFEWIDGINFSDRVAYVCTTPANYADDTSTNHTAAGVTLPSSGWIKDLAVSSAFPWAFLPDTAGGSETTYIPDYLYSDAGWRVLYVGGSSSYESSAGLFCFYANYTSSSAYSSHGARLLYHP